MYAGTPAATPTPPPVVVTRPGPSPEKAVVDDRVPTTPASAAPSKRVLGGAGAWLALLALACFASAIALRTLRQHEPWLSTLGVGAPAALAAAPPTNPSVPTPASAPTTTATVVTSPPPVATTGWKVRYEGYVPIDGGVLHLPRSFTARADGAYDLILFFHGNPAIVLQSIEHLGIDAAVGIINLGLRSSPYRRAYQAPGRFEHLLENVRRGLVARGVRTPRLRRLALGSWSAGYGAIESILETRDSPRADEDPLDAILSLDGVHAGFRGESRQIDPLSVRAYLRAAKAAAEGHLLMRLTHSEIRTVDYASAQDTQRFILSELGHPTSGPPLLPSPPALRLPAAERAVKKHRPMVPVSDTRVGLLRVRGFEGNTEDHHSAHLTQMAPIAFADLAARWRGSPSP